MNAITLNRKPAPEITITGRHAALPIPIAIAAAALISAPAWLIFAWMVMLVR